MVFRKGYQKYVDWTGRKHSPETIEKQRIVKLGIKPSAETRIKMSLAHKGKLPKNINQIKGWNKGQKQSKEKSLEHSIFMKRYWKEHPEKHPNRNMGNVSKQQYELYLLIKSKYPEAELEYAIKTNHSVRYADIAIPSKKIDIEFDGIYWHKNSLLDNIRDNHLAEVGWKTIRFNEKSEVNLQCLEI
jgi:very-short-patch-repair endonuclease